MSGKGLGVSLERRKESPWLLALATNWRREGGFVPPGPGQFLQQCSEYGTVACSCSQQQWGCGWKGACMWPLAPRPGSPSALKSQVAWLVPPSILASGLLLLPPPQAKYDASQFLGTLQDIRTTWLVSCRTFSGPNSLCFPARPGQASLLCPHKTVSDDSRLRDLRGLVRIPERPLWPRCPPLPSLAPKLFPAVLPTAVPGWA